MKILRRLCRWLYSLLHKEVARERLVCPYCHGKPEIMPGQRDVLRCTDCGRQTHIQHFLTMILERLDRDRPEPPPRKRGA